jgi:hypothetical protein
MWVPLVIPLPHRSKKRTQIRGVSASLHPAMESDCGNKLRVGCRFPRSSRNPLRCIYTAYSFDRQEACCAEIHHRRVHLRCEEKESEGEKIYAAAVVLLVRRRHGSNSHPPVVPGSSASCLCRTPTAIMLSPWRPRLRMLFCALPSGAVHARRLVPLAVALPRFPVAALGGAKRRPRRRPRREDPVTSS